MLVADSVSVGLLLLIEHGSLVLVLLEVVEAIDVGLGAMQLIQLTFLEVLRIVLHLALRDFFDTFRDVGLLRQAGKDAGLSVGRLV